MDYSMNQHREMTKLKDGNPSKIKLFLKESGFQIDRIKRINEVCFGRIFEKVQW